ENGWKWLALGESLGMPADYFDRLPPLLALFGIGTSFGQERSGSSPEYGVETVLEAEFRAAGKPIASIEDGNAVLLSLLEMNEAVLIKELDRELSQWGGDPLAIFGGSPVKRAGSDYGSPLAEEHAWAQGAEIDIGDEGFGQIGRASCRQRGWRAGQ